MNLSFSTRGWGDLSWEELIDAALDMNFTGIEVYNLFKFPALTDRGGPFHTHSVWIRYRWVVPLPHRQEEYPHYKQQVIGSIVPSQTSRYEAADFS